MPGSSTCEVFVSNVGSVFVGNLTNARNNYNKAVKKSKRGEGKYAFKSVHLICKNEIIATYRGLKE